ncbi:MAG: suppressor of fused domain protein [Planctomycetaceae bacterium]
MSGEPEEWTESGQPVYRHQPREHDGPQPPRHHGLHLEEIESHVERHIGPIETVFHEIVSDLIHLDVLFVPATDERPFQVLVTSGVSDEPMNVPPEMKQFRRAELLIALPADWPLSMEAFDDDGNYWPIRWLKQIGRLPHEYDTWIGWGHTIPNGDPPEPIANTEFIGVMLSPPYWLSPTFFELPTNTRDAIYFYSLVPLYQEEMDLKLRKGAEALERRLEKSGVSFVLDPSRRNAAKKRRWFGFGR